MIGGKYKWKNLNIYSFYRSIFISFCFFGTLVISMFDAKKQVLIWASMGSGTVKENPDAREKTQTKVIQAIMGKYPVKPMK